MLELLKIARVLGWRNLLKMRRAKRVGGDEFIRGFFATPTIIALLNVGFFDTLLKERRVNIQSFASEQGLNLDILKPLCEYLYEIKALDKEGMSYTFGPTGQMLAEMVRGSFYSAAAYSPVFFNLEPLLRGQSTYGEDIKRDTAMAAAGSGAVGKLFMFPIVQELLNRNGFTKVLDLGCGDAAFLVDLCKADPGVTGYGIDLSAEAIADGCRNATQENVQDRIHLVAEDMFKLDSVAEQFKSVQAATSFFVLHEFLRNGRGRVVEFFKTFREAFPGTSLIICESVRHTPEQIRKRLGPLAEFQLVHDLTGQNPITRDEWRSAFTEAGFTSVEEDYISFGRMVIFTVR